MKVDDAVKFLWIWTFLRKVKDTNWKFSLWFFLDEIKKVQWVKTSEVEAKIILKFITANFSTFLKWLNCVFSPHAMIANETRNKIVNY